MDISFRKFETVILANHYYLVIVDGELNHSQVQKIAVVSIGVCRV